MRRRAERAERIRNSSPCSSMNTVSPFDNPMLLRNAAGTFGLLVHPQGGRPGAYPVRPSRVHHRPDDGQPTAGDRGSRLARIVWAVLRSGQTFELRTASAAG